MANERIKLTNTMKEIIANMSEGNPGAVKVIINLMKFTPKIDPQAMFGGLAPLMSLDTLNIYGSRIWMLYKDVCKESVFQTIAVLRSWQLGILSKTDLDHAIENYGDGINLDFIVGEVKKQLPEFTCPEEI
jgi:hypothetical protein